ncbi:MAG TPA: PP2C family protein-serine/threonine phosphatase [Prolixibacteraceae bacterium]|nr:PP2C family protein-serine/threonine phosphatase [Prolixibacteraceae bacterium]
MVQNYHTEIEVQQLHPKGQEVSGDVFISRQVKEEGRTVLVLSDGAGHGIKASVLATLTATMAMNYSSFHTKPQIAAQIIMDVLPSDGEKPNYATFLVIEIEKDGLVKIINYDNPPVIIWRDHQRFRPANIYELEVGGLINRGKILRCQEFYAQKEDRIVFFTDGVTQSGIDTFKFNMGWGHEKVLDFVKTLVENQPGISATKLARKILNRALLNDNYALKDDASCGVVYFREPRELMLITGPPFYKVKDIGFIEKVKGFKGSKIVCGGTTAEIISREMNLKLEMVQNFSDPSLPPVSRLEGFELVTEGILTISKVEEILENYHSETRLYGSPADEIVKQLLQHDIINLIVGTRINWAHQDPEQPIEIEIRKTVVKRIIKLLEEKFFKKVNVDYI